MSDQPESSGLSESEISFLNSRGGGKPNSEALDRFRIANVMAKRFEINEALTINEVADLLAVAARHVRRRIQSGSPLRFARRLPPSVT